MNATGRTGLLSVVAASVLTVSAGPLEDSPEAWSTLLDLEIVGTILHHAEERGLELSFPTADWVPLEECTKKLPENVSRRLPMRDAWGRKLLTSSIDGTTIVFSRGENGISDTIDAVSKLGVQSPDSSIDARSVFGDDIVLAVGHGVLHGPRTLSGQQKETMTDLRTIGVAVESFAVDNDRYPIQDEGMRDLRSIHGELVPTYIRELPFVDAWGNPFLYWSNGTGYVIASGGSDGVFDPVYGALPPEESALVGATDDSTKDIVFADGQFAQWPSGVRR